MKAINILGKIILVSLFPLGLLFFWGVLCLFYFLISWVFKTWEIISPLIFYTLLATPIVATIVSQILLFLVIRWWMPHTLPKYISFFPLIGVFMGWLVLFALYNLMSFLLILGPLYVLIANDVGQEFGSPMTLHEQVPFLASPLIASILMGILIVLIGGKRYNIIKRDSVQASTKKLQTD